ncbi:hypothetical protein ACFQ10_13510 [Streptomyces indonesiensis]
MAHASLCTDHPGWTDTESRCYRLLSNEQGGTWLASWDGQALDFMPMAATEASPTSRTPITTSFPRPCHTSSPMRWPH